MGSPNREMKQLFRGKLFGRLDRYIITKFLGHYFFSIALIISSICMAFYQILDIDDIANGTLMYIAQAFLLAGSIFGLDYYVKKLNYVFKKEQDSKGNQEQQPTEHKGGE